ncbi:MAG: adenylate/guanylate cyclase domain-containing protein [Alphaproteobacteria bacterium]
MTGIERKLTTILAADVVGFSKMMGSDETGTLENLKQCRAIIDIGIAERHGRIFGSSGDSVVAEFSSPVQAVLCASEFQERLAVRNAEGADKDRMEFRVGVNMGDVIVEGDNLYGEGVNVAARLEAIADHGGVCLSGKVFEEIKRKLDLPFVAGGAQQLKGIIDPVPVYHLRGRGGRAAPDGGVGVLAAGPTAATQAREADAPPTITVSTLKVISGDDEIHLLVDGLHEDILGGLAKMTSISVLGGEVDAVSGSDGAADFRLEGSVRAAGRRLRLSFTLFEVASQSQVWSERYDRQLDDIFDLEDEISENVVAAVWIRLKTRAFEQLRGTENAALSVPDLLSKAAGYMVHSQGNNQEVAEILRLALDRKPDSSMAVAMTGLCRYRMLEFSSLDPNADVKEEVLGYMKKALSLDPSSYFAHLMAAVMYRDLRGENETALTHAETALDLNSSYAMARAVIGICMCHLGENDRGMEMLQRSIAASPGHTQRLFHLRELAICHFMAGRDTEARQVANRLVHQAPELARNRLVLASLSWHAGRQDVARDCVAGLLRDQPDLTLENMRPVHFADPAMAERYTEGLRSAGLPEGA